MATRTAAIYLRISKDKTGEELGVDRQRQECAALAESLGWRVAAVHSDNDLTAFSGKRRPGFEALIGDLESGRADTVIAWHTDRIYRHPRDLERFVDVCERFKVIVRTVRAGELDLSTDAGRMVARILGAVARQEVERSTDRIRAQKRQAAEQGRYRGGPRPFGYEADGLTVRKAEAREVRMMAERIVAGDSLSGIARDLNSRGITTSTGSRFTSLEVRRIVIRGRNVARIELQTGSRPRRTTLGGPAQWPAILDEDTWSAARAIIDDPDRLTHSSSQPRWLLTGIALCGVCLSAGLEVPVCMSSGRSGAARIRVYACPNGKHMTRGAEQTDAYVGAVLSHWLARPEAAEVLAANPQADPVSVLAEVDQIRGRIEQARILWTDGLLDVDQLRASVEHLRGRESELLASLGQGAAGSALTIDVLRAGWDALSVTQRRAIVRAFARVVLEKSPKGRPAGWQPGAPYFRPETVRVQLGAT